MDIVRRSARKPSEAVSRPSMRMLPAAGSSSRKRARTSVLLPAPKECQTMRVTIGAVLAIRPVGGVPVRPTTPAFCRGAMVAEMSASASGSPGRYRMQRL